MRRLVYSSAAQRDLRTLTSYIATVSGERDIARSFVAAIRARCRRLAALPGLLGTARPDLGADVRSTPHKGYILYFRYVETTLQIVAVLDARRDALAYFGDDGTES